MADDEVASHPAIHESQIGEMAKAADAGDTLTTDEKAQLEFLWAPVLGSRWNGDSDVCIPWLERYVQKHPAFFVQRAAETFFWDDFDLRTRRKSGGEGYFLDRS